MCHFHVHILRKIDARRRNGQSHFLAFSLHAAFSHTNSVASPQTQMRNTPNTLPNKRTSIKQQNNPKPQLNPNQPESPLQLPNQDNNTNPVRNLCFPSNLNSLLPFLQISHQKTPKINPNCSISKQQLIIARI
ncbi:hypothetical protein Droror1_Dr00027444 [Drosera rotundifolia]